MTVTNNHTNNNNSSINTNLTEIMFYFKQNYILLKQGLIVGHVIFMDIP